MKINRNYWVWIDTDTGHIWNDQGYTSRKAANDWFKERGLMSLKLKKIRIIPVSDEGSHDNPKDQ